MGKTFVNQTSFASGEISPLLYGRIDREIYFNGAAKLRNVYVTPLGGVQRRPGTRYIDNTTGNVKPRLISFQFSVTQTYLLVFTPAELKVYKNDVLVATVTAAPLDLLTADIIAEMNYVQSQDTLILVHPDIPPIRILRVSDSSWTPSFVPLLFIPTYDFGTVTPSGTITSSAVSGSVTLTASNNIFTSDMVDWAVRGNGGYAYITAYTSATEVTALTIRPFANTSAFTDWTLEEPVWSDSRGYPRSAAFWNQRLWFGGSKSRPQTVWGSKIAGFFDFDFGTGIAADAIEWTVDDEEVNAIQNIFGGRTLQVFSQSAEYFSPINLDRTVTPAAFKMERATRHGSSKVRPLSSDGATIFIELSGRVVREFLFLDVEQSYVADDISFLSEHVVQSPVAAALQKSTTALAGEFTYFVNSDGTIAVLNRRRAQNFIAWTLWETKGAFEDVVVVGNNVYVSVLRNINSADVRFIEKFTVGSYSDASTVLTSSLTTAWSGLTYLEGESVAVRSGGGYPLLLNEVDDGEITTETAQTEIEVGLPFTPVIRTLPPEIQGGQASVIGEKRRIVSAAVNLNESDGFTMKTENSEVRVALTQFGNVIFNQASPKFTGWKRVPLRGYSRQPYVEITQENPVDLQVLSLKLEVTV